MIYCHENEMVCLSIPPLWLIEVNVVGDVCTVSISILIISVTWILIDR
jgi:hypothetical protein